MHTERNGTVHISNIAPLDAFEKAVIDNRITLRPHQGDADLVVANYTPNQQFTNAWDEVTLNSRGLVFNRVTGQIVARPFGKFFNHNDATSPILDATGPVEVFDKLDGSCGILYRAPDGQYSVSTRGSFHSVQANHATKVWRTRYAPVWTPDEEHTFVFEIIYPDGKIVLDYGGMDDLVLLGAINKTTGVSVNHDVLRSFGFPGPHAEKFDYASYQDVFTAPQRDDREGFVIRFVNTDQRVKLKFDEYLKTHKVVFGLSKKRIWQMLAAGDDVDKYLTSVPDEFTAEAKQWKNDILADYASTVDRHAQLAGEFSQDDYEDRATWFAALNTTAKERGLNPGFAIGIQNNGDREIAGKLQEKIWRSIKPVG